MNKKALVPVLVVLVLVLLGGGFFLLSKKAPGNQNSTASSESSRGSGDGKTVSAPGKTLRSLLAAGVAQKCTYANTVDNFSSTGTMYVSGAKVRGDFTSHVEGKTTLTHMLVDGTTTYIWMDGETTGLKMTADPKDVDNTSDSAKASGAIDFDQDLNYSCTPWIVDNGMFSAPSTVTFSDLSNMVNDKCAACSFLEGDDKAQCLKSMGCSN